MNGVEEKPDDTFNPHNQTILIIDDVTSNLAVIADYLVNYGFQIKVARTGEAGLDLAIMTQPDLILLDVMLPGIDGFEVCRRLKGNPRTEEIPVIFTTIINRIEDKVRGFEVGGVDYISKPFQVQEVLARVTTQLRMRDLTCRLREAKETLEKRVAERTVALAQANHDLNTENAERRRAEEQIKKDLREKDALLKEIHHRVKNNLNLIVSLLNLQEFTIASEKQALTAFKKTRDRIYSMSVVHEMLYASKDLASVDMLDYVKTLSTHLLEAVSSESVVTIDTNIQKVFLTVNIAIPCGIIINELITNAIKHAFPDKRKGIIKIDFRATKDNTYELMIHDNGIGLSENIDFYKKESMGFQLIRLLSEQIGGKVIVKRNGGTSIRILFPKVQR